MTQILITSSVLIVAMALARLVLRKRVSQRLIYGLWLLVALRLLIPVQFGHSKYSVTTVTQSATNQVQQAVQRPIAGPSREEVYDRLLEDYLARPPMVPEAPTAPESPTIPQTPVVPEVTTPAPTIPAQVQTQLRQEAQEQVTAPSLSQILTFIWIFGMVAMAVWFFTANLLFSRKIRRDSVLLSDCHWNDTGVPLVGAIRLLLCPHLDTPCLVGLFRPTVCLTPASIEDSDTRRHVLTHELTHLRHGDHIWSLIRCLCLCVYWFNPLVWLAAILSKRDQELACDEAALLKLGEHERIPYGRTLLNIVIRRSTPGKILQTATAMSETKKQLKERIEFIVKRPKNLWFAAISLILIAALATGCAFAGSKPTTEPTQAPTNSTTEATAPELPADSPYASILTGYHALVAARLSGESPTQDTLRIFTDATGGNASLERTWNAMVADLTANLQNPTAQSFLHRTRDINGDGEPELLLLRRDGILLALFTTCQGQPRLLDAFHTGYRAVMTDQGQLYTLFYSAAGQYDYHIQTLGSDGQFTTDGAFGVDSPGTYHYEIQNGRECAISAERFEQLLQAHPFQWGDSWNNTGAAGYLLQRGERYEIFSLVPFSYHYRLFDREGNIIEERDTGSRYPGISMITDTILEIKIGYGTGVIAHHYLDLETDRISSTFLQVLCTNGDLIAYLDGEQLIVESIFGKTNLYKQIDHNLAPELVQVAQASFSSDGRILYFTYPISGESTTTHIYYLYEPQYVHDVPLGKWTATVCFQDETMLSYSLQLNQDGTAVYTMGYYRSELIEKMEGTWREADESFGEDAYYLELVPMVLDENTGALTYIHQSVFRLRLAEDGRLIRADLLDGLPLFQGISGTSLLMYHHESYSILYDFPIQYL